MSPIIYVCVCLRLRRLCSFGNVHISISSRESVAVTGRALSYGACAHLLSALHLNIVDTYKADGERARTYFLGSALSLNLPIHQRPLQINNKLLSRKTRCVVNISFEHSSKAIVSSLAIFQFQRPVYYLATYIYLYNEFARRLCDSRILNTNIFVTSTQAGIWNVMIFVCWRFF